MITNDDEGNRKILFQEQKVNRISSNMMFDFHDKKQNRRVIQYSINGSRWRNIMEDSFSYCIERHKKNTDCLLAIRIYNYDNHIIYELPYQLVFHS